MHRLSVDRFDCTISAEEVQDPPQFLWESPAVQAACGARRSQRFYGETVYFMRRIWYTQSMLEQIAAFDVGDKRVGVAFSDPFGDYAVPSDTYFRTGDFRRDIAALAAIAAARGVRTVVVGLPLNEDGSESVQSEKTRRFAAALEAEGLAVILEDERYTTRAARGDLIEMGVSAKKDKRKKQVDSIAAAYILESYLKKIKK